MEPHEAVRLFVNRELVPEEPGRRGNPGYPRLQAMRVLVYSILKGLENDTRLIAHLEKNLHVAWALGLERVPHRMTVGRWWRRHMEAPSRRLRGALGPDRGHCAH
jgi:hypothetical protein